MDKNYGKMFYMEVASSFPYEQQDFRGSKKKLCLFVASPLTPFIAELLDITEHPAAKLNLTDLVLVSEKDCCCQYKFKIHGISRCAVIMVSLEKVFLFNYCFPSTVTLYSLGLQEFPSHLEPTTAPIPHSARNMTSVSFIS